MTDTTYQPTDDPPRRPVLDATLQALLNAHVLVPPVHVAIVSSNGLFRCVTFSVVDGFLQKDEIHCCEGLAESPAYAIFAGSNGATARLVSDDAGPKLTVWRAPEPEFEFPVEWVDRRPRWRGSDAMTAHPRAAEAATFYRKERDDGR